MKCYDLTDKDCNCNQVLLQVTIKNTLPATFSGKPKFILIKVDNTIDLNITGWQPLGLCNGTIVRFQKISINTRRILFDDGIVNYRYVNRQGEVLTLIHKDAIFEII